MGDPVLGLVRTRTRTWVGVEEGGGVGGCVEVCDNGHRWAWGLWATCLVGLWPGSRAVASYPRTVAGGSMGLVGRRL